MRACAFVWCVCVCVLSRVNCVYVCVCAVCALVRVCVCVCAVCVLSRVFECVFVLCVCSRACVYVCPKQFIMFLFDIISIPEGDRGPREKGGGEA